MSVALLSNLPFAKELAELRLAMRGGYDSVAKQLRITRNLGLNDIASVHLPLDWPKGDREHLVWRARLFAKIPEDEFEGWIKDANRRPTSFCVNSIRKLAMRWWAREQRKDRTLKSLSLQGVNIYEADISKVRQLRMGKPASAVVTDPPYEHDSLALWAELARFANDVLCEHGWLLAMSGQRCLPEVFARTTSGELNYFWTLAIHLPGGESAQNWYEYDHPDGPRNHAHNIEWKPVLVFSKGKPSAWPDGFRDFIKSEGNDKRFHRWGQNADVFKSLIEKFTQSGDLVVDPFLGGGTTAISAFDSGRAFEGFDIDPSCVATSLDRMADAVEERKQGELL